MSHTTQGLAIFASSPLLQKEHVWHCMSTPSGPSQVRLAEELCGVTWWVGLHGGLGIRVAPRLRCMFYK